MSRPGPSRCPGLSQVLEDKGGPGRPGSTSLREGVPLAGTPSLRAGPPSCLGRRLMTFEVPVPQSATALAECASACVGFSRSRHPMASRLGWQAIR
jgi:hypothetical protein